MRISDWSSDVCSSDLRENIIVDPGIGFGKSLQHNLSICSRLALFQGLGAPVLFGASRKRMIGALSNEAPVGERLGGSVALAFHAVQMGAQMVRVHDVKETVQAVHLWRSEEHTSELQSIMRISYAVFCF